MNIISEWSKIPAFSDEKAEALFWNYHELESQLMQTCVHEPDARESTTITLRFDPRMLSRIKRIARSRYLNYQSMMKQWLAERLEEELLKQSSEKEEG
jgi:predicted DNA binding CopG/RHH family protein